MRQNFSKRAISTLVAMLMLASAFSGITVLAERQYAADMSINGSVVDFVNKPYSEYNMVFVPLEELCGYLGLELSANAGQYTINRMKTIVTMDAGNMIIRVNGERKMLTSPLSTRNGVVYVPAEFFNIAFNMPLEFSEDFRSVELTPNVYSIAIGEQNAAAISASMPEKDTLATGTGDADSLFYKPSESPEKEIAVYYQADFSDFADKEISKVTLEMNVARGVNLYQSITAMRTGQWEKGKLNFNNQPEEFSKQTASQMLANELQQGAKNWGTMSLDITSLVKSALMDGKTLSVKMLGQPYASQKNPGAPQAYIKGVNTPTPPYLLITVNEPYTFPIKQTKQEAADETKFSELQLLYSMGVFTEDDEFPLDMNESVTRGEFLTYAMHLRGSDIPAGNSEQFFSDVPTDSGYFGVTASAYELGYITGWQGIEFRPYDEITMGEAITILGRMLNYNIYAEERGGFTPGYFAAAKHGDLYVGVNDNTSLVSFNKMIDLMENALDAKMLDVIKYTSDGKAEYIFNEDKTILTEYWDAQKIEGIVTSNEYGSITPGQNGEEGYIRIDSKRLVLNYEPYNQYLGYKVKGYYSKTENVLLYIGTVVSDVTEVELSDIVGTSDSTNSVSFTYEKGNGKKYTETFSKDTTVIYNGKSVDRANITSALLKADGGKVTMVGTSLVTITAYETIVVAAVDSGEGEEAIYDLYEDYQKAIRLKDAEWTLTDAGGKKAELSSLTMYDVVSIARSIDGKLIQGIVSTKKVEGKVSMVENPGTPDMTITINGVEYELRNITPSVDFDGDVYWSENVKLGSEGTFLINHEGNIVGFYTLRNENILGYLVDIQSNGKSALSNDLQAAIMVQGNEEYVTYDLADKVTIDGSKKDTADEIVEYFTEDVLEGTTVVGQRIKMQGIIFSINGDKKINKIDTAYFDEENEVDAQNSLQLRNRTTDAQLQFKGTGKLGDKYLWKIASALSVVIPKNAESYEDYMVVTSGIANDAKLNPELYTVGTETPKASIVVLKGYNPGSSAGEDFFVADKIVTAFDSEGYEVKKLYYHSAPGEMHSVIIPDEFLHMLNQKEEGAATDAPGNSEVTGTISRGDIIRIGKNSRGELSAIVEEYDYETRSFRKLMYNYTGGDFNAMDRYYGGYTVKIMDNELIKMAPSIEGMADTYAWINKSEIPTFYRYEVNNSGVELFNATMSDIRPYENIPYNPTGILVYARYMALRGKAFLVEMTQPAGTGVYKLQYGVTPDAANVGGTEFLPAPTRANPGDLIALAPFPTYLTREDYKVNEEKPWLVDGIEYAAGDMIAINSEVVTVTPNWVYAPTITLTLKAGSGATGDDKVYYPAENGVYQATSVADFVKAGYKITGWTDGTQSYVLNEEIQLATADITLTAVWEKVWDGVTTSQPSTTTIDAKTYYQISNAEELAWFATALKSDSTLNAILTNDIYLNIFRVKDGSGNIIFDEEWYKTEANIEGAVSWSSFMMPLKGTFDGNGKSIYGLYSTGTKNGLFSQINGTVKNLNVLGGYLVGTTTSAANISYNYHGMLTATIKAPATIENVTTSGLITCAADRYINNVGGIAGYVEKIDSVSSISNCTSKVDISTQGGGTANIGNANSWWTSFTGIGGIVGTVERYCYITGCTNEGDIYAPNVTFVGGIIGVTKHQSSKLIGSIVNKGTITGYTRVGQIIGMYSDKLIHENPEYSGANITYTNANNYADLDTLNNISTMCQGSATATKQ